VTTRGGSAEQRRRSEYDRPETIEGDGRARDQVGGHGIAVSVDHLEPGEVRSLVGRIEEEQGRLDVLVNDVWGGEHLIEWNVPVWEHSLEGRLRMLRLAIDTHIITSRLSAGHF
jgi:NAD(P)-dependent dehydrogenase (short-subunit alcohol dehydrogenase family)